MSPVEFKKRPCGPVGLKGQGPLSGVHPVTGQRVGEMTTASIKQITLREALPAVRGKARGGGG